MITLRSLPIKDMDPGTIKGSAAYGYRIHPIYKTKKMHDGVDIARPKGTPLLAAADGTVRVSKMQGNGKGLGEYIVIDHGEFYSLYAHQSKRLAKTRQKVKAGDVIGYVGSTGDSTGPHLHFGVCTAYAAANVSKSAWIDPKPLLLAVKKEDAEMVKKIKIKLAGRIVEVDAIYKADEQRNYIKLDDLKPVLDITYDAKADMPVIKCK